MVPTAGGALTALPPPRKTCLLSGLAVCQIGEIYFDHISSDSWEFRIGKFVNVIRVSPLHFRDDITHVHTLEDSETFPVS